MLEFSAGLLGLGLLATATVIGAVLGARHLPPPFAEPFARALPVLAKSAPELPLALGVALVLGLLAAALRLMAIERSFSAQPRG